MLKGILLPIKVTQTKFAVTFSDPLMWVATKDYLLTLLTTLGNDISVAAMGGREFVDEKTFISAAVERFRTEKYDEKCEQAGAKIHLYQVVKMLYDLGFEKGPCIGPAGNGIAIIPTSRPKGIKIITKLERIFGNDNVVPAIIVAPRPGMTIEEEIDEVMVDIRKDRVKDFVKFVDGPELF
jgi:hypothetical protein